MPVASWSALADNSGTIEDHLRVPWIVWEVTFLDVVE